MLCPIYGIPFPSLVLSAGVQVAAAEEVASREVLASELIHSETGSRRHAVWRWAVAAAHAARRVLLRTF